MQSTFQKLDNFLLDHQALWRFEPFHLCRKNTFIWLADFAPLQKWLTGLTVQQVEKLKEHPTDLTEQLGCFIPELKCVTKLTQLACTSSL